MNECQKEKADYCEALTEFYLAHHRHITLDKIVYHLDEVGHEWVYIIVTSGGQKRFCVDGTSIDSIAKDFFRIACSDWQDVPYLRPSNCIEV